MTSLDRVLTTLGFNEPDRVPLFFLFSFYGANELGISIEEYFSNPELVFQGQMKMLEKYKSDCLYAFYYASIETEPFGGDTNFIENGPPNSKTPVLSIHDNIKTLKSPDISESNSLQNVLQSIKMLKDEVQDTTPIVGVVMSPFSLPIMQMGFESYLNLIYSNKELFNTLININKEFCVNWANAQLNAGATAICYFDPMSSSTIIPPELYKTTGMQIAKDTLAQINGPTATHLASGRALPIVDDIAETGTQVICTSSLEDIGEMRNKVNNRMTVLGNLDGIKMCRWTEKETILEVKNIIDKAGKGGGFILSDNHGEIPYQVKEDTLIAISKAVEEFGTYPLG